MLTNTGDNMYKQHYKQREIHLAHHMPIPGQQTVVEGETLPLPSLGGPGNMFLIGHFQQRKKKKKEKEKLFTGYKFIK